MLKRSLPSSAEKCGKSQSRSFLTFSAVASGSSVEPSQAVSNSITRLTLTLPIFHWFMTAPKRRICVAARISCRQFAGDQQADSSICEVMVSQRPDIKLTPEEQARFLAESKRCALATLDKDGYPHVVAMNYVAKDGAIWMTSYGKAQKVLNIRRNPKVCVMIESGRNYAELQGL